VGMADFWDSIENTKLGKYLVKKLTVKKKERKTPGTRLFTN
jgi:hypothetical protein